jgi:predicted nucleotidyltransferase
MSEATLWEGRTLREWVPVAVDDIVRFCDPRRIILFGSLARGEEDADSDIDLMVVLDHLDQGDRIPLMGAIRQAISASAPVDVLVTDVEQFERWKDIVGSAHFWPAHDGKVVYERQG